MRTWTLRLGLSLMVLVGFWTNRLPAQVLVVPVTPYEPAHHPPSAPAFAPRDLPPLSNHLVTRTLNRHGMGCGIDPYYAMCGNWRYEMYFAFGSCRYWFDDRCPPQERCCDKWRSDTLPQFGNR